MTPPTKRGAFGRLGRSSRPLAAPLQLEIQEYVFRLVAKFAAAACAILGLIGYLVIDGLKNTAEDRIKSAEIKIKSEHDSEIQALKTRFEKDFNELKDRHDDRLEETRQRLENFKDSAVQAVAQATTEAESSKKAAADHAKETKGLLDQMTTDLLQLKGMTREISEDADGYHSILKQALRDMAGSPKGAQDFDILRKYNEDLITKVANNMEKLLNGLQERIGSLGSRVDALEKATEPIQTPLADPRRDEVPTSTP